MCCKLQLACMGNMMPAGPGLRGWLKPEWHECCIALIAAEACEYARGQALTMRGATSPQLGTTTGRPCLCANVAVCLQAANSATDPHGPSYGERLDMILLNILLGACAPSLDQRSRHDIKPTSPALGDHTAAGTQPSHSQTFCGQSCRILGSRTYPGSSPAQPGGTAPGRDRDQWCRSQGSFPPGVPGGQSPWTSQAIS